MNWPLAAVLRLDDANIQLEILKMALERTAAQEAEETRREEAYLDKSATAAESIRNRGRRTG